MAFGAFFLEDPAAVPVEVAGATWGPHALTLQLPAGPYEVRGLSLTQQRALEHRWQRFLAPVGVKATATLEVFRVAHDRFKPVDTRGWDYALDLETGPTLVRLAGLGIVALWHRERPLRVGAWVTANDDLHFPGQLENVLRVVVAQAVLDQGGVLLHAATVQAGGGAHVFAGTSGTGKSTLAGFCLAAGLPVLGDDLAALTRGPTGWQVTPVPFAGDLPVTTLTAPVPLASLNRLMQSTRIHASPESPARLVATLLKVSPWVNRDALHAQALLDVCSSLAVHGVPLRRFEFTLDGPAVADLVRGA